MRPTTTGISAGARAQQPVRTQSQNFRPKSEWKHEESASFLFVYLPGFVLEQLAITPDYSNATVKVEGQRRLPNNRLLPVNETFSIPPDCELAQMDKQFGRGILMLKMPRTRNIVPQQQTTQAEEEETETAAPEMSKPQQTTTLNELQAVSTKLIDEKSATTGAKSDDEKKLVETKDEINDADGKPSKTESPEHLLQNAGAKEEENKEQSKEVAIPSAMATDEAEETDAKGKETQKEKVNACAAVKGKVKELNEDGKLVVNMGAAVLIILGLGLSLFYTLRS